MCLAVTTNITKLYQNFHTHIYLFIFLIWYNVYTGQGEPGEFKPETAVYCVDVKSINWLTIVIIVLRIRPYIAKAVKCKSYKICFKLVVFHN